MIGILILVGITIWLIIEAFQDRYWNKYFINQMKQKIPLNNGLYECQKCGNRMVRENEKVCSICGCVFEKKKSRTTYKLI